MSSYSPVRGWGHSQPTLEGTGNLKKAALGGGDSSGVVDRRNGEGMTTCGPTAPGTTGPPYLVLGVAGVVARTGVRCGATNGVFRSVGEDEVWVWVDVRVDWVWLVVWVVCA